MIKRNLLITGLFLGIFSVFVFGAKAQEKDVVEETLSENQNEVVDEQVVEDDLLGDKIDLGIYNVILKSQNNNKIEVSLDFTNNGYTISNLKYSVALIESIGEFSQVKRDEQISEEYFDLLEGEVLSKTIKYEAPKYLNGNFELWIFVKNDEGMNLSLVKVSNINLTGSGKYVELVPDSCFVQIEGDSFKYNKTQGVAVKEGENLLVNCQVENHFDNAVEPLLDVESHKRGLFGEVVEVKGVAENIFSLEAGESKELQFTLPRSTEPQSYSAKIGLNDKNSGELISNEIEVHYVVSGATATIQSVSLDKSFYKRGEQGKMMVMISGPADNFPDSRLESTATSSLSTEITVINDQDEICLGIADVLSAKYPFAEYEFESLIDCYDPVVAIEVKDEEGNLLAQKRTEIVSSEKNDGDQEVVKEIFIGEKYFIISAVIIILASVVALVSFVLLIKIRFFKKVKNNKK